MGTVENSPDTKKASLASSHDDRKGPASLPITGNAEAVSIATLQRVRNMLRGKARQEVLKMFSNPLAAKGFLHAEAAAEPSSMHFLSYQFANFDEVLDFVNPLLAKASEALGETNLSLAMSLAEMEARSVRIDRTLSESRAILESLMG